MLIKNEILDLVFIDRILFSAESLGFSPPFATQKIINHDLLSRGVDSGSDPSAIIMAADYFSDGKYLNATFWLPAPFMVSPCCGKQITYGMLVDAQDNNSTTDKYPYLGIDYNYYISSNKYTHTWNRILEKWSPMPVADFSSMILINQTNYNGFYEKGKGFVSLSLDLDSILYPQKYKVLFYTEVKNATSDLTTFTNWVHIPPPQIKISTASAVLRSI